MALRAHPVRGKGRAHQAGQHITACALDAAGTVLAEAQQLPTAIEAEIGDITRFSTSHRLTAYAGLVPSTRSSGGKTSHGGTGVASNRWLKWILVEIVQTLKRAPGPVGDQYRRLFRAKGKFKATTAAARKLCCYIYWMWRDGLSYEEWLATRTASRSGRSEVRPSQLLGSVA